MSKHHEERPEIDARLAPFLAAARNRQEVPLDPALADRLTEQALAAMPRAASRALRRHRRARIGDWLHRLLAPSGLAATAAVAGVAGLAIGFWVPGLDGMAGAALGWTGAPLVEAGLPWDEGHGLMALIDGQGG